MKKPNDFLLGIFAPLFYYFTLHLMMNLEFSDKFASIVGIVGNVLPALPGAILAFFLVRDSLKEFFKSWGICLLISTSIVAIWNIFNIDFTIYTLMGHEELALGEGLLMAVTFVIYIQSCTAGCAIAGVASFFKQKGIGHKS